MRGLGKGVREFNDAKNNVKREIEENASEVKTADPDFPFSFLHANKRTTALAGVFFHCTVSFGSTGRTDNLCANQKNTSPG